jgi:4-carboxymuconolactone decarboxylase
MPGGTARIAPLEAPFDTETDAFLRKWMPPGVDAEPLALFRLLARHRELTDRMRPLGAGLLGRPSISVRERELMIHRTCARAGAEYEWGVHAVAFGPLASLTEAQLDATAVSAPDDPVWDGDDTLVLRLADELYDLGEVSDALWPAVAARWTVEEILELVVCSGWYRLLCQVMRTARLEPESWARRFPEGAA